MNNELEQASAFINIFDSFMDQYIGFSNDENMGLKSYFESDWPSPCLQLANNNIADGSLVDWKPFLRKSELSNERPLDNIEKALETKIPLELQHLFCRYFSHDINASAEQGNLTILQAWNEDDFERLQKNLIAHILMKRRLKQAETLFFALTDEEDFVLSVLLSDGSVVLEKVGKEPERTIAPSLLSFMPSLVPLPQLVRL